MATSLASSTPERTGSKFTEKLLSGLRQFCDEQKLMDVTFKVYNPIVLIPAHRLVLSAASTYFENLLSSDKAPCYSLIEINDIASDTFERLIAYCYTGKTLITHYNVTEMLKGSVILQLEDAVAHCVDYIFENITEFTLTRVYALDRETQCERLRQKIQEYEIQHFKEINGSAEFLNFDYVKLKGILESEELNVSFEENVFAAIKYWYEYDTVNRKRHLPDLIGCLRLLQFDANFIMTNIHPLPGCELLALKAIAWINEPLTRARISLKFTKLRESLRKQHEDTTILALERSGDYFKRLLQYNKTKDKWLKCGSLGPQDTSTFRVILKHDHLIFTGGRKNGQCINKVKTLNLRTKTWNQLPAMICPREDHSVALLDGKMYAIGGWNASNALATIEVLSSTGEWHLVQNLNTPRKGAATVILNGTIFVMGGSNGNKYLKSVERYDPATDVWTSCANMKDFFTQNYH